MRSHIARAKSNEKFLKFIDQGASSDFTDWKITVIFYTALHYLRAYLLFKKIRVPRSHKLIDTIINPSNPSAIHPLPKVYNRYNALYQNSWESRYSGVYTNDFQEKLLLAKCQESRQYLEALKSFFAEEGLKI